MTTTILFWFRLYVKATELRLNHDYITYYRNWIWVIATGRMQHSRQILCSLSITNNIYSGIVPFVLLLLLNLKIVHGLHNLKKRQKARRSSSMRKGRQIMSNPNLFILNIQNPAKPSLKTQILHFSWSALWSCSLYVTFQGLKHKSVEDKTIQLIFHYITDLSPVFMRQ